MIIKINKKQLINQTNLMLENQILDLVKSDLDTSFLNKQKSQTGQIPLEKFNVDETKEEIENKFKNNPDLPEKIVNDVKNISDITESTLGDIQANLNTYTPGPAQNSITRAGHLVSNRSELSKSGQANSMQGAKEVVRNQFDVANGIISTVGSALKKNINESIVFISGHAITESAVASYEALTNVPKAVNVAEAKPDQKIESYYDKKINTPTRHLTSGLKTNLANSLNKNVSNLQNVRDNLKQVQTMQRNATPDTTNNKPVV